MSQWHPTKNKTIDPIKISTVSGKKFGGNVRNVIINKKQVLITEDVEGDVLNVILVMEHPFTKVCSII